MLVVEQYFRTGFIVYLWSKYLWQQILERRQRNTLNAYKTAPLEIREIINDEEYEIRRNAALQRSGFEIFKGTLNVGFATTFILLQGFRKIWEKSSDIVAYFNIQDSDDIMKNALFLTILSSGTFLVSLPFVMLEIYARQSQQYNDRQITVTSLMLDHCVAQTLLFPFVCLFIVAFKYGGDRTLLWVLGFAEFQLFNDLLDIEPIRVLPDGALRNALVELAKEYEFPLQDIFVTLRLSGQKLARLKGFPRARMIVLSKELTLGELLNEERHFNNDEIYALVARELCHWNRRHSCINFFVNQIHLCLHLYTMHRFLNSRQIYEVFYFENRPLAVGLTLLQYCPLFDLYNFVARIIGRKLEFVADENVKRIHGDVSLKRAIIRICDNAKTFPIQDTLYSACYSAEASPYERINALNAYVPS